MIKSACNCLINCNLQDIIRILVIFDISIFAKRCSFSVPSWLETEKQLSWLGKKGTPFAKFQCSKTIICCFFVLLKLFKSILQLFEKYVVECPSHFVRNSSWGTLRFWIKPYLHILITVFWPTFLFYWCCIDRVIILSYYIETSY